MRRPFGPEHGQRELVPAGLSRAPTLSGRGRLRTHDRELRASFGVSMSGHAETFSTWLLLSKLRSDGAKAGFLPEMSALVEASPGRRRARLLEQAVTGHARNSCNG